MSFPFLDQRVESIKVYILVYYLAQLNFLYWRLTRLVLLRMDIFPCCQTRTVDDGYLTNNFQLCRTHMKKLLPRPIHLFSLHRRQWKNPSWQPSRKIKSHRHHWECITTNVKGAIWLLDRKWRMKIFGYGFSSLLGKKRKNKECSWPRNPMNPTNRNRCDAPSSLPELQNPSKWNFCFLFSKNLSLFFWLFVFFWLHRFKLYFIILPVSYFYFTVFFFHVQHQLFGYCTWIFCPCTYKSIYSFYRVFYYFNSLRICSLCLWFN